MGCMCSKNKSKKESGNMEVKIQKYLEQQKCTCEISYDQIQIQIIPLQCNHKLCINCFRRAFSENSVLCPFCFKVQTYDQPLEILNTHVDQQNSNQAIDTQNQMDSSDQQLSNQQVPVGESQEQNSQMDSNQVKDNISEEGKRQAKSKQNKTQNKEENKNSSKKDKNQIQWNEQYHFQDQKKILHISDTRQNKIHLYNLDQSQYQCLKLEKGVLLDGQRTILIGNEIWAIGGDCLQYFQQQNQEEQEEDQSFLSQDVISIDVETGQIEDKSSILQPRSSPSLVIVNKYLFVIGGYEYETEQQNEKVPLKSVECIDFTSKDSTWIQRGDLCKARYDCSALAIGSTIFVISGYKQDTIEHYDCQTDQWTIFANFNFPNPIANPAVFGDPTIIFGGFNIKEKKFMDSGLLLEENKQFSIKIKFMSFNEFQKMQNTLYGFVLDEQDKFKVIRMDLDTFMTATVKVVN